LIGNHFPLKKNGKTTTIAGCSAMTASGTEAPTFSLYLRIQTFS
jgi:hypothetical protein